MVSCMLQHPTLCSVSLVPRRMKSLAGETTVVLCVCIYLQLTLNATVRVWHVRTGKS